MSRIKDLDHLLVEALRAAEMRQGCTNHTYYAEIIRKQILQLFPQPLPEMRVLVDGEWVTPSREFMDTVAQIDKAMSPPLDDEELEEKWEDTVIVMLPIPTDKRKVVDAVKTQAKITWGKAIALLQPKIEEAEKRGADSGVKAYESTCESLIVEAKKQGIRAAIDDLKMHYCIIDTEAKIKEIEEQALSGKGGK